MTDLSNVVRCIYGVVFRTLTSSDVANYILAIFWIKALQVIAQLPPSDSSFHYLSYPDLSDPWDREVGGGDVELDRQLLDRFLVGGRGQRQAGELEEVHQGISLVAQFCGTAHLVPIARLLLDPLTSEDCVLLVINFDALAQALHQAAVADAVDGVGLHRSTD